MVGDANLSVRDTIFNVHMRSSNSLAREKKNRESFLGNGKRDSVSAEEPQRGLVDMK